MIRRLQPELQPLARKLAFAKLPRVGILNWYCHKQTSYVLPQYSLLTHPRKQRGLFFETLTTLQ